MAGSSPPQQGSRGGRRNPLEGYRNINFTAETMKDLEGSASRLAGAMELEGSHQLNSLYSNAHPGTYQVIKDYLADRRNNFGYGNFPSKQRTIHPQTVINAVEHAGRFAVALLADQPPTLESQNVTETNLFDVRQMWWHRQYLLTRPADFGRCSQLKQNPLVFDAKETFLAWKVLGYFVIVTRKNPNFSSRSTQNNKAIPPSLISTTSLSRKAPTDTRVSALENALAALNAKAHAEADLDNLDRLDTLAVDAVPDRAYNRLVLELGNSLDRPATARLGRPTLSLSDIKALYASLCNDAFYAGNVLIYEPPHATAQDLTAANTTATIMTSEAIVTATDTTETTQPIRESTRPQDPTNDQAIDIVHQRQQLQVSAATTTFDAALTQLGLNAYEESHAILHPPNTFQVPPTFLKPWQVTAVAWMLAQEASPLHGGASGRRLWSREDPKRPDPDLDREPTPGARPYVSHPHFGDALNMIIFFGSSDRTGDRRRKAQTISKLTDLQAALQDLDPTSPATGTTIVISSYQTWARRTTREVDRDGNPIYTPRQSTKTTQRAADPAALNPEEKELFDEDGLTEDGLTEDGLTEDGLTEGDEAAAGRRLFVGLLQTTFQRVICDEGHRVKTISSRQHQSVAKLTRHATWFLTATPMWNKPLDFCGYLSLLWTEIQAEDSATQPQLTNIDDYRAWSERAELPTTDLPYHLLSPRGLLSLSKNGQLTSQVGFDCLPIILRLTCLCREPGHTMLGADSVPVVIGGDIPPVAITTVELRYTRTTQVSHDHIYAQIIETLYRGAGEIADNEVAPAMDWSTYRQLCHLAVNPKLDIFLRRSNSRVLSADITAFSECGDDRGFGLFFARTVEDRAADLPTNRMAVARYLAHDSPRLRFLLHLLWTEGTLLESGTRPRFLVYCNWPFTRWLVEMFLAALGIDFVVIRAGMSLEARSAAIQAFTNPESTTTVLLTTFHCGALGLNMHTHCSRVVLFEGSQNYNSVFQTIGRIHRLGQSEPQKAWLLFQDHTIQRFMEYNSTKKILPQIAAQFRPWLESQVATQTTEEDSCSKDTDTEIGSQVATQTEEEYDGPKDADTEMSDVGSDQTDAMAKANQIDKALDQLTYQVLRDMLGLAKSAPSRLKMNDFRDQGLDGMTTNGLSYSTRGPSRSAPAPVTPVRPHQERKRDVTPSSSAIPSKKPRGDPK